MFDLSNCKVKGYISIEMIICNLFFLANSHLYPDDYFTQLISKIKEMNFDNVHYSTIDFCGRLLQEYLPCSLKRYKFAKEFVTFLKTFEI